MIVPDLRHRDIHATERMDDPDCDEATLGRTYAQFRMVNRVVAGWKRTYRRYLRPLLHDDQTTTLLDIGSGGADVSRAIATWAARDGYRLHVTAADPDPRAYAWAANHTSAIEVRRTDSAELVAEGARFDLVISNHLLHHLNPAELTGLLRDCEQLARRRVVHSDIRRSQAAYALFSVATTPFFPGSFIREDGLVSIRRSFTPDELRAAVSSRSGWRIETQPPWRNLLIRDAS